MGRIVSALFSQRLTFLSFPPVRQAQLHVKYHFAPAAFQKFEKERSGIDKKILKKAIR
jgi:hypothetical protein